MSPEAVRIKPSKRPRYRYVLFEVKGPEVSRPRLLELMRRAHGNEAGPWLTRFDGRHGVLRLPRQTTKDWLTRWPAAMAKVGVEVLTLTTSGSIAGLGRNRRDIHLPSSGR